MVAVWKPGSLIASEAWAQPAKAVNATLIGIRAEEVECVAVYGFTKYGNGVASGCYAEEQGTKYTKT